LVIDGAFHGHKLLILDFERERPFTKAQAALKVKGFEVTTLYGIGSTTQTGSTASVKQMVDAIATASVVWLISGNNMELKSFAKISDALVAHHHRGGG